MINRQDTDTGLADDASVASARSLTQLAAHIGADSELVEAARLATKRRDNILGLLLRDLSKEEIAVMESRGCRAQDWTQVQVAKDFDAFRVQRVHFQGRCVLGRCAGEVEVLPGVKLPCGIFDATLIDCQVGNDCLIENVRFMANVVVEREAVVFDVGSITCGGKATFGCGQVLPVANEVGGREVPAWAELTIDDAAQIARERDDRLGQAAVMLAHDRYRVAITSPVSWVRRGAQVRHTDRLRDVYLGAGAMVDNALELTDVAMLSTPEEQTRISGGATVEHAVLQPGARVGGQAIVRHALLLEHSGADEHATIKTSIIGPNTTIAKGEVTASLLGPFVGFHHQSMLIAAFWPEGKGNVAHGAMVGSNHTGRAPDQEIWPGEGTFFGLGCAIRFPTDLSESPYSVIGMGTTTLPQKVRFPFSLISVPVHALADVDDQIPRAYNEIIPAWGLLHNAYGLVRNELKFRARDRSRRHHFDHKILRPRIMRLVKDARDRLAAISVVKLAYLEADISGLGRNFLRESVRVQSIEVYDQTLLRYCLRLLLNEREGHLSIPGSAEIAHELADELLPGMSFTARMHRLVEIEQDNARLVEDSKSRDDERGARIIPGYAEAHVPAGQDPTVANAHDRALRTATRVAALGLT